MFSQISEIENIFKKNKNILIVVAISINGSRMEQVQDMIIQVIGKNNGVGLLRDTTLIISIIKEMDIPVIYKPSLMYLNKKEMPYIKYKFLKIYGKWFSSLSQYLPRQKTTQIINIFLEHIDPYYLYRGDINCFIPNPEYCEESDSKLLPKIDHILCKTFFTEKIFKSLQTTTYYAGFTSEDRLDIKIADRSETFFHLAGSSPLKGTDILVDLWLKHLEWPKLTIVQHPKMQKKESPVHADNINYIFDYLDDDSLKKLQNKNLFHLCPSEAEGFGHYIVEAMSCGAVTLTTDAPPMNEIVTKERGVLVKYRSQEPQMLGMNYYVDEDDLEKQIIKMMNISRGKKRKISEESRQWFVKNDRDFRLRFKDFIYKLVEQKR